MEFRILAKDNLTRLGELSFPRGKVTTPVFLLGGLIPGSILILRQLSPPAPGTPKRRPGMALRAGAAFATLRDLVNWLPFTNMVATNTTTRFRDLTAANAIQRFYRAILR